MSEFTGKTVLVTGAGRGLGHRVARAFGKEGANVCVNYAHSAAEAQKTVAEIEASGGRAIACKADVSNSGRVEAMVEEIMAAFGSIDILVNNAGLSIDGPFPDMPDKDWDRVYEVNLKGPFLVSRAAARRMMDGNGGVIVNISATTTTYGRANAANDGGDGVVHQAAGVRVHCLRHRPVSHCRMHLRKFPSTASFRDRGSCQCCPATLCFLWKYSHLLSA